MSIETTAADAVAAKYFIPRRLGHVNLWVDSLAASERFYNNVAGLMVEFTEPDLIASFLGTGNTPHDLGIMEVTRGKDRYGRDGIVQLPGTIGLEPGLNHLAWELPDERMLVDAFKRLKRDDVETDLTVDHQVAHSVYIFDPDGNYNEFYCDTIKDWRAVLTGPMDLLTQHWDPLASSGSTEPLYDEAPILRTQPGAPLAPARISHAVIKTASLDQLVDFYSRIAGLKVVAAHRGPGGRAVYLGGSLNSYEHNLVLLESNTPGYGRACFELASAEDLATARRSLDDAGIAIADSIDVPWKSSIFLVDPDGMRCEFYVRLDGDILPGSVEKGAFELAV